MFTSSSVQTTHFTDWISTLLWLPLCGYYVLKGGEMTILDTVLELGFDTGRTLLGFIHAPLAHFGGPLFLLAAPAVLIAYFAIHGYRFGMQVFLYWLGMSLLFLGRATAGLEGRYPALLKGYEFDLNVVLSYLHLSETTVAIGHMQFMLGMVAFAVLLMLPLYRPQ